MTVRKATKLPVHVAVSTSKARYLENIMTRPGQPTGKVLSGLPAKLKLELSRKHILVKIHSV